MRISASVNVGIEGRAKRFAAPQEAANTGRNLPAVLAVRSVDRPSVEQQPSTRPLASVLAQLAASAGDHPFTRARRRADPAEAASVYGLAAQAQAPARKVIRCIV